MTEKHIIPFLQSLMFDFLARLWEILNIASANMG